MSELPVTRTFKIRPVYHRYLRRKHWMSLDPPTEQEIDDARRVLRLLDPPVFELDELLLSEAERILDEAAAA